ELIATVLKAAEIERQRIEALAEAQKQKLATEAEAMTVKAAAFHQYNQAAVLDKLLTGFPEVVRAMAEPLAKVDKITIVSTGDGQGGLGASQITGDVAKMIAQVPALFETLSGMKVGQLMEKVPGLTAVNGEEKTEAVSTGQ
ncbi:MAG: flotillin family protein, partial [Chloroflexi bacterium]|nr:flotillin family protein [Chloroflexota bacterium]